MLATAYTGCAICWIKYCIRKKIPLTTYLERDNLIALSKYDQTNLLKTYLKIKAKIALSSVMAGGRRPSP